MRLAVTTFEDRAGFQGGWDLSIDVARALGRHIARAGVITVVPLDSVRAAERVHGVDRLLGVERAARIGELVDADYVVTASVTSFGVRRLVAGDPNLAGYKSYRYQIGLGDVEIVRTGDRTIVETFDAEKDSTSRPFEINLFGRPGKEELEFKALFETEFDSEAYHALPFGRFAEAFLRETGQRVVNALVERPAIDLSRDEAVVLAVDGDGVFLGIGSEDRVEYGDVVPLLRGADRVGLVKVGQIIAPHLCRATILEHTEPIVAGLRIGPRLQLGAGLPDDGAEPVGAETNH